MSCAMLPNKVVDLSTSDSEADELAMCVQHFFPEGSSSTATQQLWFFCESCSVSLSTTQLMSSGVSCLHDKGALRLLLDVVTHAID